MADISDTIATYIEAKDHNRPWLMRRVFTADAQLEMVVNSDAISFPPGATGRGAMTDVLVRQFSLDHENVYTFCLCPRPDGFAPQFSCTWLVGMSRRDTEDVRVGCGRYDWSFSDPETGLADRLRITIEVMQVVAREHEQIVMGWLSRLDYPWCQPRFAFESLPEGKEFGPIPMFLSRNMQGVRRPQ